MDRQQRPKHSSGSRPASTFGCSSEPPASGMAARPQTSAEQLRQREDECMRRNAELEERTSQLMHEAQAFLEHERESSSPVPTSRPHTVSGSGRSQRAEQASARNGAASKVHANARPKTVASRGKGSGVPSMAAASRRPPSAPTGSQRKPPIDLASSTAVGKRPDSRAGAAATAAAAGAGEGSVMDQAAAIMADDESEEIAVGAMTRLLQARVVVLQEELQSMAVASVGKDNKMKKLATDTKQLTEDKAQLSRQLQATKSQLERQIQLGEQAKKATQSLEKQLSSVRKDHESSQTTIKQLQAGQSAMEVRLNRALEEVERCKASMQQRSGQAKESSEHSRQLADQLQVQAKQHEKQKGDLIAIFKKQQKLIDVLKQQKMHVEAARVLEFSEKEFISLLDWGSSS